MSKSLRIIFAGTPDFAARHLDALLSSGHQIVGVFTQPDRPAGRGKKLMPSPVKVLAEMARMTAETRFVYLMRDPVDRLWSHVRMDVRNQLKDGEDYLEKSREHLADLLAGRAAAKVTAYRFSDYKAVIEKLRAAVPAEKTLVMFQEDLMTPAGVKRLCAFLGIRHVAGDFGKEVNAGRPADLPEEDRAAMRRALRPQYEFVAQNFPDLPASWQRTMSEGFA